MHVGLMLNIDNLADWRSAWLKECSFSVIQLLVIS